MGLELMPYTESYDDIRDIVRFMGWDGDRWVRCGIRRDALIKRGSGPEGERRGSGQPLSQPQGPHPRSG